MHLYTRAVNVCPDVLPFPGGSAPSGIPQGKGCPDFTQLWQQNSPTAHSAHTSPGACVQTQAGAVTYSEHIWKSLFQGLLSPPPVFFVGKFVRKLESHLPQRKAVPN